MWWWRRCTVRSARREWCLPAQQPPAQPGPRRSGLAGSRHRTQIAVVEAAALVPLLRSSVVPRAWTPVLLDPDARPHAASDWHPPTPGLSPTTRSGADALEVMRRGEPPGIKGTSASLVRRQTCRLCAAAGLVPSCSLGGFRDGRGWWRRRRSWACRRRGRVCEPRDECGFGRSIQLAGRPRGDVQTSPQTARRTLPACSCPRLRTASTTSGSSASARVFHRLAHAAPSWSHSMLSG